MTKERDVPLYSPGAYADKWGTSATIHPTGKYELCGGVPVQVMACVDGNQFITGKDILVVQAKHINAGDHFRRRVKNMTPDMETATKTLDTAIENFAKSMRRFDEIQDGFVERGKRASSSVRDAAEKLSQGLARVEKAANFERLEKYVELLERASTAMKALAELEASGKLDKIASAIR